MRRIIFAVSLTATFAAQAPAATSGESLYLGQCSFCHGKDGEGGRGATLQRRILRHAPDEAALRLVIRRGIAGSSMPGTALSDSEIDQVAKYVRSLGRRTIRPLPGDPNRGERLYQGKGGCPACHAVSARGGSFGPDLTEIGAARSPAYLRASVVEPGAEVPRGFVQIRAVTKNGGQITGARVNEDTFSVQIRDAGGVVHSLWKEDLNGMNVDLGKSPMPSYGSVFSKDELDDLVAYLAALRGTR